MSALLGMLGNAVSGLLDVGKSVGMGFLNEYFYNRQNRHLTGKEVEQNTFNAEQAQINRDWQQQMSDTANQRAVADMQKAGLNPALMYGNGNAASTPTGSNAQGSASVSQAPDMASMMAAIQQMKLTKAEIGLKQSQAALNDAKAEESKVNAAQIVEMTENIKQQRKEIVSRVEGIDLDNKQKEILIKYADEQEQWKLNNLKKDYDVKEAEVAKFNKEVEKMDEEKKKIVQEVINLQEQVRLMMSQEHLNSSQANQCAAMIGQINEYTAILNKDNSHYDFNHMKTLSFKDGVAVVPDANGEYKGSFTGASAAIRPNPNRKKKKKEDRW